MGAPSLDVGAPSLDERAGFTGDPNRSLEVKLMDYQKFKNHGGPSPSKGVPHSKWVPP